MGRPGRPSGTSFNPDPRNPFKRLEAGAAPYDYQCYGADANPTDAYVGCVLVEPHDSASTTFSRMLFNPESAPIAKLRERTLRQRQSDGDQSLFDANLTFMAGGPDLAEPPATTAGFIHVPMHIAINCNLAHRDLIAVVSACSMDDARPHVWTQVSTSHLRYTLFFIVEISPQKFVMMRGHPTLNFTNGASGYCCRQDVVPRESILSEPLIREAMPLYVNALVAAARRAASVAELPSYVDDGGPKWIYSTRGLMDDMTMALAMAASELIPRADRLHSLTRQYNFSNRTRLMINDPYHFGTTHLTNRLQTVGMQPFGGRFDRMPSLGVILRESALTRSRFAAGSCMKTSRSSDAETDAMAMRVAARDYQVSDGVYTTINTAVARYSRAFIVNLWRPVDGVTEGHVDTDISRAQVRRCLGTVAFSHSVADIYAEHFNRRQYMHGWRGDIVQEVVTGPQNWADVVAKLTALEQLDRRMREEYLNGTPSATGLFVEMAIGQDVEEREQAWQWYVRLRAGGDEAAADEAQTLNPLYSVEELTQQLVHHFEQVNNALEVAKIDGVQTCAHRVPCWSDVLSEKVMEEKSEGCPSEYLCPLTHMIMVDPWMTAAGQTYERRAILKWLDRSKETTDPCTRTLVQALDVRPNHAVRGLIEAYMGQAHPHGCADGPSDKQESARLKQWEGARPANPLEAKGSKAWYVFTPVPSRFEDSSTEAPAIVEGKTYSVEEIQHLVEHLQTRIDMIKSGKLDCEVALVSNKRRAVATIKASRVQSERMDGLNVATAVAETEMQGAQALLQRLLAARVDTVCQHSAIVRPVPAETPDDENMPGASDDAVRPPTRNARNALHSDASFWRNVHNGVANLIGNNGTSAGPRDYHLGSVISARLSPAGDTVRLPQGSPLEPYLMHNPRRTVSAREALGLVPRGHDDLRDALAAIGDQ